MKKIIITILALVVLSLALMADEVVFDKVNRDEACNIQGHVQYWDGTQYINADGEYLIVTLYYNNSNTIYDQAIVLTNENGNYAHDFINKYGNSAFCDRVSVEFRSNLYYSSYDGIERIDIKWYKLF